MTIQKAYNKYLSQTYALLEMVKCIGMHEISLKLSRDNKKIWVHYLIAYNLNFLMKHIERFEIKKEPRNFYISCAYFDRIPILSYNLRGRKDTAEYKLFDKDYEKHVVGYDFFIDCDGKEDFSLCKEEAINLMELFESHQIPFYIINSSRNGFHFIIPYLYLPKKPINELLEDIRNVVGNIKAIHEYKTIDNSIYDIKRVRKLPYSPVDDGSVCLPLSDYQLRNFFPLFSEIENVLENVIIKYRGLLLRTYGLNGEQLKKNVQIFFKEYL